MRRIYILGVALGMATLGIPVFGHGTPRQTTQQEQAPDLMDMKGTVRADNSKITFVADEGGKSWEVINSGTLKDYVDHHIQVSAHVYPDKGQIQVMTVVVL